MNAKQKALLEAVLSDPEVLLAARSPENSVAGPWVKAESKGVSVHGGFWRLSPDSGRYWSDDDITDVATIHPFWDGCDGIREPNRGYFYGYCYCDEDHDDDSDSHFDSWSYDEAMKEYQENVKKQKA